MIKLKTPEEIKIMQDGGHRLAKILQKLASETTAGTSTKYLNNLAHNLILEADGIPSFLDFQGYPFSICISINEEVVHGMPSDRTLEHGDIVGLDIGMLYRGFHTDTAITVPIGEISSPLEKLISTTKKSLNMAIKSIKPGIHLGDIQFVIQKIINDAGYGIVKDLTGHGIGRDLQEDPSIPNFGKQGTGPVLKAGMVLAIEPMVNLGKPGVDILSDGWTIVTSDNSPSAHFEHTIAVVPSGAKILTI